MSSGAPVITQTPPNPEDNLGITVQQIDRLVEDAFLHVEAGCLPQIESIDQAVHNLCRQTHLASSEKRSALLVRIAKLAERLNELHLRLKQEMQALAKENQELISRKNAAQAYTPNSQVMRATQKSR